jgi:hypothetical protein
MDIVGILKEAWATTWRHKALWILGLFVGGSASVSTVNWQMDSRDFQGGSTSAPDWESFGNLTRADVEQAMEPVVRFFQQDVAEWLPWLIGGIALLIVIGFMFWILSVAARGGLIDQTNVALAGETVSVRAGWRMGFRRWGRVFLVGFLLALPLFILGAVMAAAFAGVAITFAAGNAEPIPGLLGLGALVPVAVLLSIAVGVLVGLLSEVSYRHAVLGDLGALDSIRAAWDDVFSRRGVTTMWLVMLVVGIGAGVAAGIVMVPLLIVSGLIVGATVMGAGLPGLWTLLPLGLVVLAVGMLIKSVYSTFQYAAWTEFYRRMTSGRTGPDRYEESVASDGSVTTAGSPTADVPTAEAGPVVEPPAIPSPDDTTDASGEGAVDAG